MRKILVPVDGSANAERAVRHAIALAASCPSLTVLLLNVQPEIDDIHVRRFIKPEEVEAMSESRGGDALRPARELLEAAGVSHASQVLIGPVAETIASFARQKGCDSIVMGTRGLGAVAGMLLGSVATKVIHFAEVPVTLIK